MAGGVPVCVEGHAVFSQNRQDILLASAAEQVVLSLVDGRSDVSFLIADIHPFLDLFAAVICKSQLCTR